MEQRTCRKPCTQRRHSWDGVAQQLEGNMREMHAPSQKSLGVSMSSTLLSCVDMHLYCVSMDRAYTCREPRKCGALTRVEQNTNSLFQGTEQLGSHVRSYRMHMVPCTRTAKASELRVVSETTDSRAQEWEAILPPTLLRTMHMKDERTFFLKHSASKLLPSDAALMVPSKSRPRPWVAPFTDSAMIPTL
jgi:hypothetical protein